MKTAIGLIVFALVPSVILASDRDAPRLATMQQQPKTGLEGLPAAVRRLKLDMGREAINRTLGIGTFVFHVWTNPAGSCQASRKFPEGYKLTVRYDYDPSSLWLKSATLSRGGKIIAEMKK